MNSGCPKWLNQSIIYQVFTGRWQAEIEANQILKIDKFNQLTTRDWSKLINLGINCFYFLGIFDNRGPIIVDQENGQPLPASDYPRLPSLFALTNHSALNPAFGSQDEFINLVTRIHHLGAKVIVDFIPNHTATTHPWVSSHPHYYQWQANSPIAEFSGDVYKLNYANPELCQQMISVLDYIRSLGVDGVRCDMAHLVPVDFWQKAITHLKSQNPDFAFLAEAYPNSLFDYQNIKSLYQSGFDAIYNNNLYENIKKVMVEASPLDFLISSIKFQKQNHPKLAINYFFNHDDPPLDNKSRNQDLAQLAQTYQPSLFALILFLPELAFIYNGSLCGLNHRLAHHWLEPLAKKYLETDNSIPDHLKHLFDIRKNIKNFNLKKIWQQQDLLLFELDQFRFILNLSKHPQSYHGHSVALGQVLIETI